MRAKMGILTKKQAITKVQAAIIGVVIVIAAIATGVYYLALPPPPKPKVHIHIPCFATSWHGTVKRMLPEFMETYPDIEVTMEEVPWWITNDRQLVDIMAGTHAFDLYIVGASFFQTYAASGFIYPLDEFIEDKALPKPDFADFHPKLIAGCSWEDKLFALPAFTHQAVMYYNERLMQKYGVKEVPKTLDEYKKAVAQCYHPEEGIYGGAIRGIRSIGGGSTMDQFLVWYYGYGAELVDKQGRPWFNSTEGVAALTEFVDLIRYAHPDCLAWSCEDNSWLGAKGHMVFDITDSDHVWIYQSIKEVWPDIRCTIIPEGPAGRFGFDGWWGWGINTNTPYKKEAYLFLTWATSAKVQYECAVLGLTPASSSVLKNSTLIKEKGYIHYALNLEAYEYLKPRPYIKEWSAIETALAIEVSLAQAGAKTPLKALTDATQKAWEIMKLV